MTKKDQIKQCQNIRDKYNDNECLTFDDFEIIDLCLKKHRWYKQKIGTGRYKIYVDTNKEYKTRGFFIQREDGTKTDFSFYECIYPTNSFKKDFIKAARAAIAQDIIDFRDKDFSFSDSLNCPLCSKEMNKNNSHVDHHPYKFTDILDHFILIHGIKDFQKLTEPENWDNIVGVEITDISIKEKWIQYHKEHAKFRILCPECNLKLG